MAEKRHHRHCLASECTMSWQKQDQDSADEGYTMYDNKNKSHTSMAHYYSENPYDIDLSFRVPANASGGKWSFLMFHS